MAFDHSAGPASATSGTDSFVLGMVFSCEALEIEVAPKSRLFAFISAMNIHAGKREPWQSSRNVDGRCKFDTSSAQKVSVILLRRGGRSGSNPEARAAFSIIW
jgi:hypothetical protein